MVVGAQAREVETVVIGSGPGGYVAAIRAATLGQKVTLIEKGNMGGVCLNVGCIPSKALIGVAHAYHAAHTESPFGLKVENPTLDWNKVQEWKQNEVVSHLTAGVAGLMKKNKIEVIKGEAFFKDNEVLNVIKEDDSSELIQFDNAIIATGSRPIEIPGFKFGKRIVDSTGALSLPEIPKKLVIIGGGVIGAELGSVYANLGTEVTILEGSDHVLNGFDKELITPVLNGWKKKGVQVLTSAKALSSKETDTNVEVTYEANGKEETITADYLLVSVGRRPNTDEIGLNNTDIKLTDRGLIEVDKQMRTTVKHIYAIGDIVPGPALAHKASFEGKVAAAAISGEDVIDDHMAIPAVAYVDPELAVVGLDLDAAKAQGIDAKSAKFVFAANGRALTMSQTDGFIRLVFDKDTKVVLGGQIVGPSASDLISEISLAVENGLTVDDIALTIHPHPTLGEGIMDAAEIARGLGIHV